MPFVFPTKWAALFALQAALSVAAGAFGAHALNNLVDPRSLGWWQTGCQYLMYHALAGLIVIAFSVYLSSYKKILVLFGVGNLLFVGSLYSMTLSGATWLGAITPIGGVCYLLGWLVLIVSLLKARTVN